MLKTFYKNLLFITLACYTGTTNPTPTELVASPNLPKAKATTLRASDIRIHPVTLTPVPLEKPITVPEQERTRLKRRNSSKPLAARPEGFSLENRLEGSTVGRRRNSCTKSTITRECLVCRCEKNEFNFKNTCCEVGRQTCKACVANMNNLEEMRDEEGHAHPISLRYSLDANKEECKEIDLTEKATPLSQSTWTWKEINGFWYFLENNTWWRYESENGDKSRVADGWRYIPVARCACGKKLS